MARRTFLEDISGYRLLVEPLQERFCFHLERSSQFDYRWTIPNTFQPTFCVRWSEQWVKKMEDWKKRRVS